MEGSSDSEGNGNAGCPLDDGGCSESFLGHVEITWLGISSIDTEVSSSKVGFANRLASRFSCGFDRVFDCRIVIEECGATLKMEKKKLAISVNTNVMERTRSVVDITGPQQTDLGSRFVPT